MKKRGTELLSLILLFFAGCGTDAMEEISISGSWDLVGFEGENIQFVRSEGHAFYLATETEIYRSEDLSDWTSQNMSQILKEGEKVRDFLVFSETEILGVVLFKDETSPEESEQYWDNFVSLFRTTDGGENWEPLYNEFTENEAYVNSVSADSELQNTYAVHGGNVARSLDRGLSWSPVHWFDDDKKWVPHTNVGNINVNPFDSSVIWAFGSNLVTRPQIIRTIDEGETWDIFNPNFSDGFGGGPVRDVLFSPGNRDKSLIGTGNSIQLTPDSGETWERVYDGGRILALVNGTVTDEAVYASGRLFDGSDAGKLFLNFTPDFGRNWQTFIYEDGPDDVRVNALSSTEVNGQETVLLATTKGLFSFSVIL